jgi:hypothetical protein
VAPHLFARTEYALTQTEGPGEPVWLGLVPKDDGRYRLGLQARWIDGELIAPWRAPVAGFSYRKESISVEGLEQALVGLQEWVVARGGRAIRLDLPPDIYHPLLTARLAHALGRTGYASLPPELHYWIRLPEGAAGTPGTVGTAGTWKPATRTLTTTLNQARRNGLTFLRLEKESDKLAAVEVAHGNRERLGRPVRLGREGIAAVESLVPVDWWGVRLGTELHAAAAVYRMPQQIGLVALGGSTAAGRELHAMDLLYANLIQAYARVELRYLDFGISTLEGEPNAGLMHFKESFGCQASLRHRFVWERGA